MAARIDYADIQGDILRAYGDSYARTSYVFLTVSDAAAGRAWLGERLDQVTTAIDLPSERRPHTTFNLAFTSTGLAALGLPAATIATFSDEFNEGMAARAQELGDVDASAVENWDETLKTGERHVLVTINARSEAALHDAIGVLKEGAAARGLSIAHEEHAELLPGKREHFGFADGFAQPALEVASEHKVRGGGVPEENGWRPLALGEFILGYPDEETRNDRKRRLPSAPADPLGSHGTYMIWRKLYQDVALFRRTLRQASGLYEGGDEELLAAKVVGRWRTGAPLVSNPDATPAHFDARAEAVNDFRYRPGDTDGHRCPLGAHIRRSNPRDALGFDGKLTFRHRIIRRGMPYGPELDPSSEEDDEQQRGLVFVCFNASISRQFESIQRQWLDDGNVFGLGEDTDFLLGAKKGKMTVQGATPFFLSPQGPFVATRGGEYLFVPGITALAAIADGVGG